MKKNNNDIVDVEKVEELVELMFQLSWYKAKKTFILQNDLHTFESCYPLAKQKIKAYWESLKGFEEYEVLSKCESIIDDRQVRPGDKIKALTLKAKIFGLLKEEQEASPAVKVVHYDLAAYLEAHPDEYDLYFPNKETGIRRTGYPLYNLTDFIIE